MALSMSIMPICGIAGGVVSGDFEREQPINKAVLSSRITRNHIGVVCFLVINTKSPFLVLPIAGITLSKSRAELRRTRLGSIVPE